MGVREDKVTAMKVLRNLKRKYTRLHQRITSSTIHSGFAIEVRSMLQSVKMVMEELHERSKH